MSSKSSWIVLVATTFGAAAVVFHWSIRLFAFGLVNIEHVQPRLK